MGTNHRVRMSHVTRAYFSKIYYHSKSVVIGFVCGWVFLTLLASDILLVNMCGGEVSDGPDLRYYIC